METILTSPTQEVRIGPEQPFVIIGERINPTGRKKLAEEMAVRNYERVKSDALAQVAAGAQMLDVNAGIPMVDEPRENPWSTPSPVRRNAWNRSCLWLRNTKLP
jgi:5-methyltetrahydrofolate--homocysteine methyltransferase